MATLDDKQQYSLNALLYDAVTNCNLDRVNLCLSRGAQAGKSDMAAYFRAREEEPMPLAHLAYKYYDRAVLDALAKGGLPVDEKDRDGYTALAKAVSGQRIDCVRHFLALGAGPLEETVSGKTVLDLARENKGYSGIANRDNIIDALLTAVPLPGAFNDAAKKSDTAMTTAEPITISKPLSLTPHRKDGFQL